MAKEKIEEEEKKKKLKSKHKLNKMSDKLISAQFSEGYAFRGLISLLKQIIPSANLIFTKKGISIKRSDNSEQILILVEIDAIEKALGITNEATAKTSYPFMTKEGCYINV